MAKDVGTGTTIAITGVTSYFTGQVNAINFTGFERPVIDVTDMETTGGREKIAGDLVDYGSIDVDVFLDPDEPPPMTVPPGLVTITFPSSKQWTFTTGFASNWTAEIPLEDRMISTLTVALSGDFTEVP